MTSLKGVRAVLKTSNSEHATLITSLVDSGKLAPYNSKEAQKRKFGLNGADNLLYAILGKKQAPAALQRKLPTANELQDICLRDLPEAREYFGNRLIYFVHSDAGDASSDTGEEAASVHTIHGLTDGDVNASRTMVTFPSEALEEVCNSGVEQPEGLLRAAMTTCIILPENTLLPLHHSNEGTTVATLLSGCVVWVIWPPTDRNLRTLQTAYERYAEDFDDSQMDVAGELEGGMIFVQTEGDGVRIPPFCPMMCFTTKTSVLTATSQVTIDDFIATLHKLPLLKAWYQTEIDGERMLSDFNTSILRYLDVILNGDPDDDDRNKLRLPQVKTGALASFLATWDNIKDGLAAIMGPADSKTMENIWEAFLIDAKGRECWMCNKSIRNKQKLMKQHFIDAHWANVEVAERIDSMEAIEKTLGGGEGAGKFGREEIIVIEDDDTMQVDE